MGETVMMIEDLIVPERYGILLTNHAGSYL